jgi:hypothetical protein
MPSTSTFYSDNDTGTFADPLKGAGLAEVLRAWLEALGRRSEPMRFRDCGSYFQIDLPSPLSREDANRVARTFMCGQGQTIVTARHIKQAEERGEPVPVGYAYEEQRAQRDAYYQRLGKLTADERRAVLRDRSVAAQQGLNPPDANLGLYVALNHFKVADPYNGLVKRWLRDGEGIAAFQANLALLFDVFSVAPNRRPERPDDVTSLQIVNPATGKGGNAPKADSLGTGNQSRFWLDEYLKFVGFFTTAAPIVVRKSKDRKTFVLHPVDIPSVAKLGEVMRDFRGSFGSSTATKVDILAALRFTETLVEAIRREQETRQSNASAPLSFGPKPRVIAIGRGFDMAFYKDMGSAFATMNLATINLPSWLPAIESLDFADQALSTLREHIQVIRSVQTSKGEEGSEEVELLRRYRDFLSGDDITRFFDFAARLGDYTLAKRYRKQLARQFTTTGMETLVSASTSPQTFTPIIQNDGFKAIAAAIRASTVVAQYHAARGSYPYEVRYGLGQELLRATNSPEEFLSALGEFAQSYNAERARVDERIAKKSLPPTTRRRPAIHARHIDEIVTLLDHYHKAGGATLIGRMLVAYGYARDPRVQAEDAAGDADQDTDIPELSEEG